MPMPMPDEMITHDTQNAPLACCGERFEGRPRRAREGHGSTVVVA